MAFDTTARNTGDPPRDEAKLQDYLSRRLSALGAGIDLWEPEPTGTGNVFVPDDLDFRGRPQLVAHLPGSGGGRSLLLNGHIDAVSVAPRELWTSDPHKAEIREGRLYGRGTCDMKGGLAGMLFALETLHRLGIKLAGDVVFCADTDEESSGAGAQACADPACAQRPASAPSRPGSTSGSPAAAASPWRYDRGPAGPCGVRPAALA